MPEVFFRIVGQRTMLCQPLTPEMPLRECDPQPDMETIRRELEQMLFCRVVTLRALRCYESPDTRFRISMSTWLVQGPAAIFQTNSRGLCSISEVIKTPGCSEQKPASERMKQKEARCWLM